MLFIVYTQLNIAQLAGTVEYTDCTSSERYPPPKSVLDMTQNNLIGEAPVMMELWEMQSNPSLPSLPGPLWPGVIAPDRSLSMDQIEPNCVLMLNCIA